MLEVPTGGHALELALQIPGEAVVGTLELIDRPATHAQGATAVQAGIVEAANGAILAAHDDDRGVDDVVDHMVARLLDLILAAHHLPALGPELLRFQLVEPARAVTLD